VLAKASISIIIAHTYSRFKDSIKHLKGQSSFTRPHVIPNLYDFHSSVEHMD